MSGNGFGGHRQWSEVWSKLPPFLTYFTLFFISLPIIWLDGIENGSTFQTAAGSSGVARLMGEHLLSLFPWL